MKLIHVQDKVTKIKIMIMCTGCPFFKGIVQESCVYINFLLCVPDHVPCFLHKIPLQVSNWCSLFDVHFALPRAIMPRTLEQ